MEFVDFQFISEKNGIGEFIYRPSNYPGPIAINATVKDANSRKCPTIQPPSAEAL
jgi:hypothetical protein